jgi:hypothetical protein
LYLSGPAGGRRRHDQSVREVVAVASALVPRAAVQPRPPWSWQETALQLRDIAIARSGDKGNRATLSVIARDPADFPRLEQLPEFRSAWPGATQVSWLGLSRATPCLQLGALHFVLHDALAGGVTRSLALDAHGKTCARAVLSSDLDGELP